MTPAPSIFELHNEWREHNHIATPIGKEFVEFFGYLEANNYLLIKYYNCKFCRALTKNVNYKNEHVCTNCAH